MKLRKKREREMCKEIKQDERKRKKFFDFYLEHEVATVDIS